MEKVVADSQGCWIWTAAKFDNGYGAFREGPRQRRAHRWSYEYFTGPIPDELVVMHRCDVKVCVNPDHLTVGTTLHNQQDMTAKGRGRVGDRNGGRIHAPKLTPEMADEIRSRYVPRKVPQYLLAEIYGVTQTTISSVIRRRTWS